MFKVNNKTSFWFFTFFSSVSNAVFEQVNVSCVGIEQVNVSCVGRVNKSLPGVTWYLLIAE